MNGLFHERTMCERQMRKTDLAEEIENLRHVVIAVSKLLYDKVNRVTTFEVERLRLQQVIKNR